jgi:soluble lytic murein transglycosylase-like protein
MKKFPFFCLLLLASAAPLSAQNNYRYDNFDTPNGVRIANVETTATLPATTTSRTTAARPVIKAGLNINNQTAHSTLAMSAPTRAMNVSTSLNGFTTGDAKVDGFIIESGLRNNVDPVLLYAQMHQESSFKRGAISPKGARGLMQLMPGTAARFGVTNIFDPKQNIEGGARYMRFLLDHFNGDVSLALAGYNAGEGAVLKYGRRIPPYRETQDYVRRISQRYSRMRDGEMERTALNATSSQVATLQTEPQPPAPTYERKVFAIRLPDGRLQLVSQ